MSDTQHTNEITIDKWVEVEVKRISRFMSIYQNCISTDPECFPATMLVGEWDEQYNGFIDEGEPE